MKLGDLEFSVASAMNVLGVQQNDQKEVWRNLRTIKKHDLETYNHSLSVGLIARDLAYTSDLNPKTAFLAGLLHDIGKTRIDKATLTTTDALTPEQWSAIKEHPRESYRILTGRFPLIAKIALIHHQFQKDPYPVLRKPLEHTAYGNLISTADFYDAIINRTNATSTASTHATTVLERFEQFRPHQQETIKPLLERTYARKSA